MGGMAFRFGSARIDLEQRQLIRDGHDRHLSPKAFDLLVALLRARPTVLTKEALMAQVWPDTFVSDANLAVLVGEIRAAIGDPARSPRFIRTHHSVGYSFIGEVTELARSPSVPLHGPTFVLKVGRRRIVLPQGTLTVGRDEPSDIVLDDHSVSRHHARIHVDRQNLSVEDLNSKNGTRVEGVRIQGSTPVKNGQSVIFGVVETTVTIEESSDTSTLTIDDSA